MALAAVERSYRSGAGSNVMPKRLVPACSYDAIVEPLFGHRLQRRRGARSGNRAPPRFALAPGGDSGAVPTAMAIRAGAEMATPKGRRHRQFCALREYIQWFP